jgi:hypothetical protein
MRAKQTQSKRKENYWQSGPAISSSEKLMNEAERKTRALHFFPLDADGSLWDPTGKGPDMNDALLMSPSIGRREIQGL